jgi:hypothetical protein
MDVAISRYRCRAVDLQVATMCCARDPRSWIDAASAPTRRSGLLTALLNGGVTVKIFEFRSGSNRRQVCAE